jgi:PPP family 3-phenylpropionic acid transporter
MAGIRAVFILVGAAMGVFTPFISVLLSVRGFEPAEIGIITAVSSAAFTVCIPIWSHLADVTLGRRRALVIAAVGAGGFALAAGLPLPAILLGACFVGFSAFESAWGPLADALAVNAVHDHARDYSRIRLLASGGFAITVAAAGYLYDRTGYGPTYTLCLALSLALAASAVFAPDIARADLAAIAGRAGRGRDGPARGGSFAVALRVQPRLRGVLFATGLAYVGVMAGFTYLPLRIVDLGGQPSDVALAAAVAAFAEIPAMLIAGALAARIGLRGLFALSSCLYAACFASWVVIDAPALIIASRAFTGFGYAGMGLAAVLTMWVLLPPRLQATGQGLYQVTAFGLAAILANLVGGLVYGSLGHAVLFAGAAVLALVAAFAGFAWLPRRGEAPVGDTETGPETTLPLASTPAG